jgi:hypothetical protein
MTASRGVPAGSRGARSAVRGDHSLRSGRGQKLLDRGAQGAQQHLEVRHGVAVGDQAEEHVAVTTSTQAHGLRYFGIGALA